MPVRPAFVAPVLLLVLVGCSSLDRTAASPARDGTRPASLALLPSSEPVLQLWQDAAYLLNTDASALFVLWEDGKFLQRLPNRILYRGKLDPQQMEALMAELRDGKFFDGPATETHVRPDGGSQTIAAKLNGVRVRLSYDGMYDAPGALEKIAPPATPSRDQAQAFVRRWHLAHEVIRNVNATRLERLETRDAVPYPTTQLAR